MIMSGPGLINMELSQLSLALNTNIISLNHIFHVKWKILSKIDSYEMSLFPSIGKEYFWFFLLAQLAQIVTHAQR